MRQLSPVYGVIFLFKYPTGQTQSRTEPEDGSFDYGAAENTFFAAQTIQNACGTQALLSVLLNHDSDVEIGTTLKDFKEFTAAFPQDVSSCASPRDVSFIFTDLHQLRGEALSNSDPIRETHNSFARSSPFIDETQRQATEDDDLYHFIAYTPINGQLYELDGLQPAPINHGACAFEEFPEKVIPVLQRRIGRYPAHEIRFNLLAMARDLRIKAREVGDQEWLFREEEKRRMWQWENALRRHNFVGFVGELMKGVVKAKASDGTYDTWVEEAKKRTKQRVEEGRKKGYFVED